MEWFVNLFSNTESIPHIALLYAIVIAVGVYLGKIKVFGISLGVTFVLFAGIVVGHLYNIYGSGPGPHFAAPVDTLGFIQDFGLILFVFMIGLQVGPGFFESFGKAGIKLNALAVSAILLNIIVMFICYFVFFYGKHDIKDLPMMVGTLYGAVTNTPGLGAANEALSSLTVFGDNPPQIASAYACAYPLGVLGIIGAIILVRYMCRVKLEKEEEELAAMEEGNANKKPYKMHLEVTNKYLEGKTLLQVHDFLNRDFVVSRLVHEGELCIPNRDTVFHLGDQMLIVCAEADQEAIMAFIGPKLDIDFEQQDQPLVSKRILITNSDINGKTLASMHFSSVHGVNVTRVTRHGMDLFASGSLPLQVGDRIMVVGPEDAVDRVANKMGNSVKRLDHPNIATIFVGIILGLIFGSLPLAIPGMPVPVKLGLAGGPLIIAILIGRYGYKIHLVTYTTTSANMMLREIGLVLFLASVGIKAGSTFFSTVVEGDGMLYVLTGFLITIIPILIIGPIARRMKFNYFTIAGMLAGTYTDPPALAYANSICSKEAPAIGYSTVYPLAMFLRILTAQLIVLFFCGQLF